MRLPTSVLARVRGSIAVVALVGCSGASESAPVPAPLPPASVIAVAAPAPDPVAYDDAREAARLARLDERHADAASVRAARMDHVASLERARTDRLIERVLGGAWAGDVFSGQTGDSIGMNDLGNPYGRTACMACGRG